MFHDLISIDQLSVKEINQIHDLSKTYLHSKTTSDLPLKEKIFLNFFFENSTRTRTSFEIAATQLGARVVNIDISLSSLKKGESIIDTAKTINAMRPDFVAIRHNSSGIVTLLKQHITASLINAGDGTNEHPTQALLDSFILKERFSDLSQLKIAICGDVLHSRVARSNIKLLKKFGSKIKVITPPSLITKDYRGWLKTNYDVEVFESLTDGIKGVDVVMMLRLQQERMLGCYVPSLSEYFKYYGLSEAKLKSAGEEVLVMHPGPINREVEIESSLADNLKHSLILDQVEAGVSVRKALLTLMKKSFT